MASVSGRKAVGCGSSTSQLSQISRQFQQLRHQRTDATNQPRYSTGERKPSPKPNHLSGYFKYSIKPAAPVEPEPAPMIPQRSLTNTRNNSAFSRTPSVSAFEAFVFFWAEGR
ncbi:hypothetical protein J3E68DRAFT_411359 [Trichoderma sp. SZMC 28012]